MDRSWSVKLVLDSFASDSFKRQRGWNRNVSSVCVKLLPQMRGECQILQLYINHGTVLELLLLIVTCIEPNCATLSYITNSGIAALWDRTRPGWLKCHNYFGIVIVCRSFNTKGFPTLWVRSFIPVSSFIPLAFGSCEKCDPVHWGNRRLFKIHASNAVWVHAPSNCNVFIDAVALAVLFCNDDTLISFSRRALFSSCCKLQIIALKNDWLSPALLKWLAVLLQPGHQRNATVKKK